jgi:hypothetical protein
MKRAIAYIFLFIFSFQVLPIKEIGKILYKGLMTEERNETAACEDEEPMIPKLKKESEPLYTDNTPIAFYKYLSTRILTAIHTSEQIPKHHVPDIFTPPPNFHT